MRQQQSFSSYSTSCTMLLVHAPGVSSSLRSMFQLRLLLLLLLTLCPSAAIAFNTLWPPCPATGLRRKSTTTMTRLPGIFHCTPSHGRRNVRVTVATWISTLISSHNNDNCENLNETLDTGPIKKKVETATLLSRRGVFWKTTTSMATTTTLIIGLLDQQKLPAVAAVTDETQTFGGVAFWDKNEISKIPSLSSSTSSPPGSAASSSASDEVSISISIQDLVAAATSDGGLGIELGDIQFRDNQRVVVKSIRPNSLASRLGIQKDWIIVALDGQSTERTNAEGVAIMLSRAIKSKQQQSSSKNRNDETMIEIRFRDPSMFRQKLQNLSNGETTGGIPNGSVVSTQVAPGGTVKKGFGVTEQQSDQTISVSQLIPPKICKRGGAQFDDLLEISYLGTVVETGQVFDGSAIMINGQGIPGRGNDVSLYFVLGKQPMGQFPPGWDVGMVGQCIGERRRILIPPVLAYGSTGLPRRGIPPDATLQYDITLVSINGLSTPQ